MSRIAVIGAGAWGTALTVSLARRSGHRLTLWAHSADHAAQLADTGENTRYLPGFILPADVDITHDLKLAIAGADIILCVTPSQALGRRPARSRQAQGDREEFRQRLQRVHARQQGHRGEDLPAHVADYG